MERKLPRHTMTSSCTSCLTGSNRLLVLAAVAFVGFVACLAFIVYLIVASTVASHDDVSNLHNRDDVTTQTPWLNTTMTQHAPALDSNISSLTSQRRLVFVGVLSVQPYFKSRLSAISSTWGRDLDSSEGQRVFFTDSREQETEGDLKEEIQTIEGRRSVSLTEMLHAICKISYFQTAQLSTRGTLRRVSGFWSACASEWTISIGSFELPMTRTLTSLACVVCCRD